MWSARSQETVSRYVVALKITVMSSPQATRTTVTDATPGMAPMAAWLELLNTPVSTTSRGRASATISDGVCWSTPSRRKASAEAARTEMPTTNATARVTIAAAFDDRRGARTRFFSTRSWSSPSQRLKRRASALYGAVVPRVRYRTIATIRKKGANGARMNVEKPRTNVSPESGESLTEAQARTRRRPAAPTEARRKSREARCGTVASSA